MFESPPTSLRAEFEVRGFLRLPPLFGAEDIARIVAPFGDAPIRGGLRNVLDAPHVRNLVKDPRITTIVAELVSAQAFAVRGILFDKSAASNWALDFHRDEKIAVRSKADVDGYSSWSTKDGVFHVQAPRAVLSRQIAFRIALDPCPAENGSVTVIPGSHKGDGESQVLCEGDAGSVLIFSSLLLHGSSKASNPSRRRVLHLEFCDQELADPLEWNWRLPI